MSETEKDVRTSQDKDCFDATSALGMGSTVEQGSGIGSGQPDSVDTDDRNRGGEQQSNSTEESEGDIGGILGQLRFLQQAHLNYVQAHAERLEARLAENKNHQDEVLSRMKSLEDAVARLLGFTEENQSKSN
ncbi:MAG: hypothetical protein ACLFT0_12495 [Spirulinaceae cyanobacterium]